MKRRQNKTGVTLVEILVVVAIIAILVTMVIGIAARIDTQGKERLTENTIALLTAALGEFGDYGYSYSDSNYADFKFPLDCNNFPQNDLEGALKDALGTTTTPAITPVGAHEPNYSGSEALYFFLSRVPDCRETLGKIDKSLITNKGSNGADMTITIDGKGYPLLRIIDPWGETLRYDYYNEELPPLTPSKINDMKESKRAFPVITSAGPDKEFGSADDIRNR
jgi:prepilin-type N-terminal cleavage/methylation domain-containing protein